MIRWQHELERTLCGTPLQFRAPAKVNLRLKVEGRRDDGMHLLSMLLAPIELSDDIRVEFIAGQSDERRLSVAGLSDADGGVTDVERNLLTRAITGALRVSGLRCGFSAVLHKRIPVRAGLGGGSSDAGSLLRAFIAAAKSADAPQEILHAISATALPLGADVPFFLEPRFCLAQGVGEVLSTLQAEFGVSCPPLLLVVPRSGLESGPVFREFARSRAAMRRDQSFAERCSTAVPFSYAEMLEFLDNDLLSPAQMLLPELGSIVDGLNGVSGIRVQMTGSGSVLLVLPVSPGKLPEEALRGVREVSESCGARVIETTLGPLR